MTMHLFAPRNYDGSVLHLPMGYQRKVKWLPQIGDIFPDFKIDTTEGPLEFWNWAEGSWVFLFSHPEAYTSVCSTELGALARTADEFRGLNTKILGLTRSSIESQLVWHEDIARLFKSKVWFPTAADPDGRLSTLFGMQHKIEHDIWPIRKSFIIDPSLRIQLIFEYPLFVGRSVDETLRVIEALQLHSRTGFATPADWCGGDPVLVPEDVPEEDVIREIGVRSVNLLPYLRVARQPSRQS
jgi:thioredoxin-dependent peroxiredoxin